MLKKVVIAGSASLQDEATKWLKYYENLNYEILDYPRAIDKESFMELYPKVHIDFLEKIILTDMLFLMNEDKNGISGYIGYEGYAELLFGLSQKLVYKKDIKLILLKMPSTEVGCYEEIDLWLKLGWIKLSDFDKID